MTENEWHEDAELAVHDSHTHAKPKDAAPNHLRCMHYNGTKERCRFVDGHPGEHVSSKEQEL